LGGLGLPASCAGAHLDARMSRNNKQQPKGLKMERDFNTDRRFLGADFIQDSKFSPREKVAAALSQNKLPKRRQLKFSSGVYVERAART
jgi:hypothetical protein